MSKIQFTRKEVADRFETDMEKDITVHCKGYNGKLSRINMAGAESILRDKNVFYLTEKKAKQKQGKEETPSV